MPEEWLIRTEGVSKKFCKRLRYIMLYGLQDLAKEIAGANPGRKHYGNGAKLRTAEFWALRNISFELKPGECIGVIGPNGAGKTTLLKILGGILRPDEGKIRLRGRVGALIELGAGFHPMLSGRENIYINGSMLGMSKDEINKKFDSIVDFSGIEDFLGAPLKTYSSGMSVRLGFSIAIHTDPDILLVDEVLAVGDAAFQRRCQQRIQEMLGLGAGLILVSHNMSVVQNLSSRILLLLKGNSVTGSFSETYPRYLEESLELPSEEKAAVLHAAATSPEVARQTGEVKILEINIAVGDKHDNDQTFVSGGPLNVEVRIQSTVRLEFAIYSVGFYREDGILCFSERSDLAGNQPAGLSQGTCSFKVRFDTLALRPGVYCVEVIINDSMGIIPMGRGRSAWFKVIDSDSVGTLRVHAPVYRQPCSWEWND